MSPEDCAEPFQVPISDTLDLHSVPPRDIKGAVEAWLMEVKARGFFALRIIHGRGIGVQRELVRKILEGDPDVASFSDAPAQAGGWGATVVNLVRSK